MLQNDRTRETTTTSGTGTITMLGAVKNFQSFSTALGATTTPNVPYAIIDSVGGNWEVGYGTWTTGTDTLSRDFIVASSNAGAAISLSGSVCDVFITSHGPANSWPLLKESTDAGEVQVVPINFMQIRAGNYTINGGSVYIFGDRYHI